LGLLLVAPLCAGILPAAAQPARSQADTYVAAIAEGWAALSKGDTAGAAAAARRALAESPRGVAAVTLSVEVEIQRAGAVAGLDAYESWMGAAKVDAPYVIRRVATAFLHEIIRQRTAGASRLEALRALAADQDPAALASLRQAGGTAGVAETRMMAALGDERAIRRLITQLQSHPDTLGTIKALVDSRSALAVSPLVALLGSDNDDHRAAAADALGRLGAHDAVERIRPLLKEPNFVVRMAAAGALYRLGDDSGAVFLDGLLASEHPAVRLSAAEALSARPGGAWLDVARQLASESDEVVRLGAARLLAAHDRELAERVLDGLQASDNPAIREEAARTMADRVATDFRSLRRLLRSSDPGAVVRGAARILELTRS
jgi:HEAT repeat protein